MRPPEPTGLGEVHWLEPIPDTALQAAGPDARYELAESVSLAFVTALQLLPPRQVAALILRDVLEFPAGEVAAMLEATVDSVNSLLKRARAGLRQRLADEPAPPPAGSPAEDALVSRFARAYQAADLDALVDLLTDDVFLSMPPIPYQYRGRDLVLRFLGRLLASARRVLVPTRANGQPAFGLYHRAPDGTAHAAGLLVLGLSGGRVSTLTRFESSVLPRFGLPPVLPA